MNRIRKFEDGYQVLITPNLKIFPDSPLLVGNWQDENLRNYEVLTFKTLNDAQCEAFKYPDIDWFRFILNHEEIFRRLESLIKEIIDKFGYNVQLVSKLMTPEEFKNTMFNRVIANGNRFNLRHSFNDIISFSIINPWTTNLHTLAKIIQNYRIHLHRDDLRLKEKRIIDGKIISMVGLTEFGTTYEIKFIPSILYNWAEWCREHPNKTEQEIMDLYKQLLISQNKIDNGVIIK